MIDLSATMARIREGKLSQFAQPILIRAAQQTAQVVRVDLGQLMSTLWIPPTVVQNGQLVNNPTGIILGIQINRPDAPVLPWGLGGNSIVSFSGPVECLYVQLLSGTASDLTMLGARGVGIGYSGALAGGTPSASPSTQNPTQVMS